MMTLKKIREDLGDDIFLISCPCHSLNEEKAGKPWEFFIDLKREFPTYNPQTGIVRCPRCGDAAHRESILLNGGKVVMVNEESRQTILTQNPDTGEKIE